MQNNLITLEDFLTGKKPKPRSSMGWRSIGGSRSFYRSKWEANYARHLEWLLNQGVIVFWAYEPKTFWFENIKRGVRSYKPDFFVRFTDGEEAYIEVKGWMDPKSKTKIKRFRKYYPFLKLEVVGAEWFQKHRREMKGLIPDWE